MKIMTEAEIMLALDANDSRLAQKYAAKREVRDTQPTLLTDKIYCKACGTTHEVLPAALFAVFGSILEKT